MKHARLYVDFNEMLEEDLVLLSKDDRKIDSSGVIHRLCEGITVEIYMDDFTDDGIADNLIATGVVELVQGRGWAPSTKWACRIDARGIRSESDE